MKIITPDKDWNFIMFSKHIQKLPIDEAAEGIKNAGLAGVDLTVRPGGHVEPEKVEDDLPRLYEQFKKHGVQVVMLTTEIKSATEPNTEKIVRTASALGIKYYKTGYFPYRGFGTLAKQREEVRKALGSLAKLNLKYGITGGYHNHSADFFGAALWDIYAVLKDLPPAAMGFYFDPAHAMIEGGSKGWIMGMELLADKIVMVAVKDYCWAKGTHRYAGGRQHSVEFCPLASGNVPWDQVIDLLQKIGYAGPVSFHSEYQGGSSFADLTEREVLQQTAKDVAFFKSLIRKT
ncbi:MAG: sugar phosphate isomerase/epimerase [Kiritimatiellaeota bacterium]|nr:sugar phosphate isomerase/epimerase [Kiritimatiellota bacterium]